MKRYEPLLVLSGVTVFLLVAADLAAAKGPLPPAPPPAPSQAISLLNLTSGPPSSKIRLTTWTTPSVTFDPGTLGLVHVMGCCDLSAPEVTSPGMTWELLVTHLTGEKRHWVYRAAAPAGASGPITFAFADLTHAMWIVDEARGTAIGNNGADGVGATAWQDSQRNADHGAIPLAASIGAVVGFTLAGSGAADDIVPEPGYVETGQAETPSLFIDTFFSAVPDTLLEVEFRRDSDGTLQVMSWLMLAVELLPSAPSPTVTPPPTITPKPTKSPKRQ